MRQKFDICDLSKTNGKCEVMFGEVVGRVSGVGRGRAMEMVAQLLSKWLLHRIVQ